VIPSTASHLVSLRDLHWEGGRVCGGFAWDGMGGGSAGGAYGWGIWEMDHLKNGNE